MIDEEARLAVPFNGTVEFGTPFIGKIFEPKPEVKPIPGLNNCTSDNLLACDVDGNENSKKIIKFSSDSGVEYAAYDVYTKMYIWAIPDISSFSNSWFGKGKWFIPSVAELRKMYNRLADIKATAKLIPPTIVRGGYRYGYTAHFDYTSFMSSNQADTDSFWSVSANSVLQSSKWPHPTFSSNGTAHYYVPALMPMVHY